MFGVSTSWTKSGEFPREMPEDYSERIRAMEERWYYENKEYEFPSIKTKEAKRFYDQARESAKSPEPM